MEVVGWRGFIVYTYILCTLIVSQVISNNARKQTDVHTQSAVTYLDNTEYD